MENSKKDISLDDSLSDFVVQPKRKILGEIDLNSNRTTSKLSLKKKREAVPDTKPRFISVGIQCVPELKEKSTQNGNDKSLKSVSYAKKFDKDNLITYRILLNEIIPSKDQTLEFCFKTGLLPDKRACPTCGGSMSMINDTKVSDGHRWYCRVRSGPSKHEHRLSLRTGTFFEKSNMTLEECLQFFYLWTHGMSQDQIQHELQLSSRTDVDWASFCREVCETTIIRDSEKIGGKDIIVEIDESKFAKRKYNVGHRVQGGWVFGGREKDDKRKVFMEAVPDRTADTLLAIIQKWVAPGSIIWSDCWRSYNKIPTLPEGYKHATVNHSQNFVDPETGTCTNRIESDWRHAKAEFPRFGTKPDMYSSYLAVFMWKRKHAGEDLFMQLVRDIAKIHPGPPK